MTTWQSDIYGESEPLAGDLARGAYISVARIIVLSVISMGLYWLYWMYRTWKQYRDHTVEMAAESGVTHHPVWHGLTQIVPVYGFFRYHAHIRQYKELMEERGIPDSLDVGLLTTVVVINGIVGIAAGTMRSPDPSTGDPANVVVFLSGVILSIIALIVTIVVLCVMQSSLNSYWASVDSRLTQSARFGKGEVVCIVLGVLFWLGVVADIIWT
jgi:hypothetical protein